MRCSSFWSQYYTSVHRILKKIISFLSKTNWIRKTRQWDYTKLETVWSYKEKTVTKRQKYVTLVSLRGCRHASFGAPNDSVEAPKKKILKLLVLLLSVYPVVIVSECLSKVIIKTSRTINIGITSCLHSLIHLILSCS